MPVPEYAVITAAGLGSRLELDTPKCLVEINRVPLIQYQLELLREIPTIFLVVGFKEKEVINCVRKIRRDVIFVRNPNYRTTTNIYSLHLASKNIRGPFISLDGDVLMHQSEFNKFIKSTIFGESVVAITPSKSEEAVSVYLDRSGGMVTEFRHRGGQTFEWTGLAYLHGIDISPEDDGYVYRILEKYLPLRAVVIDCYEIDTPRDLEFVRKKFLEA